MIVHVIPVSTNDKAPLLSAVQTSTITGEESTDGPPNEADMATEETDFDAIPNMQEVIILILIIICVTPAVNGPGVLTHLVDISFYCMLYIAYGDNGFPQFQEQFVFVSYCKVAHLNCTLRETKSLDLVYSCTCTINNIYYYYNYYSM